MLVHIDRNGERYGPYSIEDINAYLADGTLLPTDLAWQDGMTDWLPLGQIQGVAFVAATQQPANYFFKDANNQQFGPITLEALFSFQAKGALHAQSLVFREGTTEWKPFHTFPEASQAMELQEAIALKSLLDSVDDLSVEIFGSKGNFDSMEDLVASVIGNTTCLGIAPVKTWQISLGTDVLAKKWKASGGIIEGETPTFWDRWGTFIEFVFTVLIAAGIWYLDLLGPMGLKEAFENTDMAFGLVGAACVLFPLFTGWMRKKIKGIQKVPDICVLTQSRFTCIAGLLFNKKKKKFAFERVVSIPKPQLECKTWDILIFQQMNVFTKTDEINILGLSSDMRLILMQSSRSLEEEKIMFGEKVIGIKKAKQILNSNRA